MYTFMKHREFTNIPCCTRKETYSLSGKWIFNLRYGQRYKLIIKEKRRECVCKNFLQEGKRGKPCYIRSHHIIVGNIMLSYNKIVWSALKPRLSRLERLIPTLLQFLLRSLLTTMILIPIHVTEIFRMKLILGSPFKKRLDEKFSAFF